MFRKILLYPEMSHTSEDIFFKLNFTQAYCVLKIILSYMHVSFSLRETKIITKNLPLDNLFIKE